MHPIAKLKRRTTIIFSCLTGLILLGACVVACLVSVRQQEDNFDALFSSHLATINAMIQNNGAVNMVELYQYEKENDVIVAIFENGVLLEPALPPAQQHRAELLEAANPLAISKTTEIVRVGTPPAGRWLAGQESFTAPWGARVQIVLLKSTQSLNQAVQSTILLFSEIFLASLLCLIAVSNVFAAFAAKPMQEAYQQQLEFTTAASHDLRTPIAIIKSSAQIIGRKPVSAKQNAEVIAAEADRLTKLVDDLLILSSGKAGHLPISEGVVNLDSILIHLYDSMEPLAQEKGKALAVVLPDGLLPKVYGDESRIAQILSTLVSNAIEYSGPSTGIEISPVVDKKYVCVCVVDHGVGIPDEEKAKVFQQFYRVDKSRKSRQHYGLGLPIAKRLAELQNARLTVADTPNGGATFVLRLKICP